RGSRSEDAWAAPSRASEGACALVKSGTAGAEDGAVRLLHQGQAHTEAGGVAGQDLNRRAGLVLQQRGDPKGQGGGLVLALDHDLTLPRVPALGCDLRDTVAGAKLVAVLEPGVLDGRPARLAAAQRAGPIYRVLPAKLVRAVVDADLIGGGAADRVPELALRDRRHELGQRDLQLFLAGGLLVDEQDGLGGRHAPTGRRGATDEGQGGRGCRGRRRGTVRVRGIVGEPVAVVVQTDRVRIKGEVLFEAGAGVGQ